MFSKLHERLGTAGFVVAVVALIAALTGTAFAAAALNSKQKKEVKSIAKQFAGKPGPAGATGAQGPAGAPGAKGDKGDNGTNGKNVQVGTATSTPVTGECPGVGGATVQVTGEVGTKKAICNGSPWTAGGTLPKNATETGTWSLGSTASGTGVETHTQYISLSFTVPLSEVLEESNVVYVETAGQHATECPGSTEKPKAAPGFLCIYKLEGFANNINPPEPVLRSTGGVIVRFDPTSGEFSAFGGGSWAVQAE